MSEQVDWFAVVAGLLGGLGLFLLGLRQLADGLKNVAGDGLVALLTRLTSNRFAAVATGIVLTAVVQSSSITTVLVVGFVAAGAMTFRQSIGVILGANVGTTITAQVIAFDIRSWALLLVAIGALGLLAGRSSRIEVRFTGLLGLGLIFFGMQVMADAVSPLREHPGALELFASMGSPLVGASAGAAFTAIVQSSSATAAMVITLAGQGLLSLPAGAAILLGANVGSCATALLAALGKTIEPVRVAVFHVLVNVLGALAWLGLLDQLIDLAATATPGSADEDLPRTLANAHTIFNVSVMLVLLPLAGPMARLVERLVPDRRPATAMRPGQRLDTGLVHTPALALSAVRAELEDLGSDVVSMLEAVPSAVVHGRRARLSALEQMDDEVDLRYRAVIGYLGSVARVPLDEAQDDELVALLSAADALENIGDIVETNLVQLGVRRIDLGVRIDSTAADRIRAVHALVVAAVRDSITALVEEKDEVARGVLERKAVVHAAIDAAIRSNAAALGSGERQRVQAYALEVDVLENLRRIFYFARRLARARLAASSRAAEPGSEASLD